MSMPLMTFTSVPWQLHLSPILAAAEICRRYMWAVFRLEYEHLELYRPSRHTPEIPAPPPPVATAPVVQNPEETAGEPEEDGEDEEVDEELARIFNPLEVCMLGPSARECGFRRASDPSQCTIEWSLPQQTERVISPVPGKKPLAQFQVNGATLSKDAARDGARKQIFMECGGMTAMLVLVMLGAVAQ